MQSPTWHRADQIEALRSRLWTYVSPASSIEPEAGLLASALLQLPRADAARLGELQFLLGPEVEDLLHAMPRLARTLSTTSTRFEEMTSEGIRGPMNWPRTFAARGASGRSDLFATAPAIRDFQTPENELLVHVLEAIVATARHSGWQTDAPHLPVRLISQRAADASRWLRARSLAIVQRVAPTARSVARIRSSRTRNRYAPLLQAFDAFQGLVGRMEPEAVRRAIERTGLVVAEDSTLFELLVTFELLDALAATGWRMAPLRVFSGGMRTTGVRDDGRKITLWYQGAPAPLPDESAYRGTLTAHGFTHVKDPIPDQVLRWTDASGSTRWLLVENKLSEHGVEIGARRALHDLLFYRRAFDQTLSAGGEPYGLGVAWGEDLRSTSGEVLLATPDTLHGAVRSLVL